ncbi:MAG: site-specific integrase [Actinomycetota bacterium]|nr:site-specific integrase [Actinomycetota bacterium]
MASIDKRDNGHYRTRWREYPGGPQKTRTFARKKDAERFLDHIRGDLARGLYIDPDGGQIPFREYAEQWRAGQIHRRSTAQQAETYLRNHAYPTLGHRPLGAVRRSEIQGWVKRVSDVLAPTTTEVVYRWVATIFKAAVADRLIPASPCIRIALPKRDRSEVVPLEVAQVEAIADAVNRRYRPMIIFTAGMGLRPGEVFGLTTDRVDFLHRQVRVDRQLIGVLNGRPEFGPPKSAAGYRTVPMPAVVTDVLAAHLARFRARKFGLVFTNTYRRPLA